MNNGDVVHLETRENHHGGAKLDALVKIDIKHTNLLHFIKTLKRCGSLASVNLLSSKIINLKCQYFTTSMHILMSGTPDVLCSPVVSPSYIWAGSMQSSGNEIRARAGHGTSWLERQGIQEEENGDRQHLLQFQTVSREHFWIRSFRRDISVSIMSQLINNLLLAAIQSHASSTQNPRWQLGEQSITR